MKFKLIEGGICAPKGFTAGSVVAGICSKKKVKKDLALIFSEVPAVAVGVFTQNIVKAAPLWVTQENIKNKFLQAVVINSRNANACTGEQGMKDAREMCFRVGTLLGIEAGSVAVASTGVIGVPLPMENVVNGINAVVKVLSKDAGLDAALAIMTTDTFPKQIAVQFELAGEVITIGGMSKGSGMVHPNMATILGFVTTDVKISHDALDLALKNANRKTFNMITVDGDTSTNDMLLLLANGCSNNREIQIESPEFEQFSEVLEEVLTFLATEIVRDGEGATKLFEVQVTGAACEEDARMAARSVCKSLLVKTAIFGCDANWGRILCALGYSGANFDPSRVNIYLGDVQVMMEGTPLNFDEARALQVLSQKKIDILCELQSGNASAKGWGCDLSYDYVKINGAYRT